MNYEERINELNESLSTMESRKDNLVAEVVFRGIRTDRKFKNSGAGYLGEIPEEWDTKKIGEIYELRIRKVSDVDYPPLSVTMKGVLPQLENVAKTNAHDDRKLVKKGDFVINSRSDRRNSCGISPYDGSVSLINTVLKPKTNMNYGYFNWLFHTVQFADEFYKWGHGIVDDLWTTGWDEMKNIALPVPPIEEQREIAEYLDKKCAEIDDVIGDIKAQIESLSKMRLSMISETITRGLNPNVEYKDSGIVWLGQIPAHWQVLKNKYIFDISKVIVENPENYQLLSLTTKGIREKDENDTGGKVPENYNTYQVVVPNDIVMCLFDLDCSAVFSGLSPYRGMISPAYKILKTKNGVAIPEYMQYVFMHAFSGRHYKQYSKSLRFTVNADEFGTLFTIVPPIEEQREIAEYLDKKCAEIDDVIGDKEKQLGVLEEYKKSLIFEVVTGKRGV